jgi:hypothetical protein
VGADIDVNANDFARGLPWIKTFHHIQKTKHGSGQNKRPTVCDASFQDQISLYL